MRSDVERRTSRRSTLAVAVGVLALSAVVLYEPARAQTQFGVVGRWTTLSTAMPINPVHVALLRNGKVLVVSGSGNVATETNFRAAVWDPQSQRTIAARSLGWDMFCNGMVALPDGRVLINGGNLQYDPFHGQPRNAVTTRRPTCSRTSRTWRTAAGIRRPRLLGDGRVMTFSGLDETGGNEQGGRDLHRRALAGVRSTAPGGRRRCIRGCTCSRTGASSTRAPGRGSRFFNPVDEDVVGRRRHHQVRRHAHLRHVGARCR